MSRLIVYNQQNVSLLEAERTMVFSCFIAGEMNQMNIHDLCRIASQLFFRVEKNWDKHPRSLTCLFSWCYFGSLWHRRLKGPDELVLKHHEVTSGLLASERLWLWFKCLCHPSFFSWPHTSSFPKSRMKHWKNCKVGGFPGVLF